MAKMSAPQAAPPSIVRLRAQLLIAAEADPSAWGQIGDRLIAVRDHNLWRTQAASLHDWVLIVAEKMQLPPQRLWLYVSATEMWDRLRARLPELPMASEVDERVPLDFLPVLDRLNTVAATATLRGIVEEVLAGRMRLKNLFRQLRALLAEPERSEDAIQAALAARPLTRVLGVNHGALLAHPASTTPATILSDDDRGHVLVALEREVSEWAGEGTWRTHLDIRIRDTPRPVDLILVVESPDGGIHFHGVFVPDALVPLSREDLAWMQPYFDATWVVLPPARINEAMGYPRSIGLMLWRQGEIHVLRRAQAEEKAPQGRATACALLLE